MQQVPIESMSYQHSNFSRIQGSRLVIANPSPTVAQFTLQLINAEVSIELEKNQEVRMPGQIQQAP